MSKDFAIKLKTLRKDAGVTQEELAKVLNVGRSTISEYERGVIEPKRKTLVDIAFYFSVPIDYFFKEDKIKDEINIQDISLSIQDLIKNIEHNHTNIVYKNKKLSEYEQKIILEMLKSVIKIIDLL